MIDHRRYNVALVGATGAVGEEFLVLLEARSFPVSELSLFASPRSEGKNIRFKNENIKVQKLTQGCFKKTDFVFFDASDAVSKDWVPEAINSGATVIDCSSVNRLDPLVPLVVPEINADQIRDHKKRLIAGPNCVAIPLSIALKPIQDFFGLQRVTVSTYQSASGAGRNAVLELTEQTQNKLQGKPVSHLSFSKPIPFNCIPSIGKVLKNGCTSEEEKIVLETQKILDNPQLDLDVTSVRVPTVRGHGATVVVDCVRKIDIPRAIEAFQKMSAIKLHLDDVPPTNLESYSNDFVWVGRLRISKGVDNRLLFWIVSDNLRKGAALNAIQIAETLF